MESFQRPKVITEERRLILEAIHEDMERKERLKQLAESDPTHPEYVTYLEEVEYAEENLEDRELREAMENAIYPFIKEKINNNDLSLASFGNHDHLGFVDENFWGHYVVVAHSGLIVTVYRTKDIKGNPMLEDGVRGEPKHIFIKLDKEDRELLVEKLRTDLADRELSMEKNGWHQWDQEEIDGLYDAIALLSK